jgi:hypothetical protein
MILIALDGSILKSFFLADFTRVAVMFTLILSGLRYTLMSLSHFLSLELSETYIPFILIRTMRTLAPVSFLV